MSGAPAAGTWEVQPASSRVSFRVKHLGFSSAAGHFDSFAGRLEVGADGTAAAGSVRVASVRTGDQQRDSLLASRFFFEAEEHPEISFASTAVERLGGGRLRIEGELTIRGRTRPLRLDAEVAEQDGRVMRLSAADVLSRAAYGLRFRGPMSAGNRAVGDRVSIELELELELLTTAL
jgi:polyisoprenoid-binding protein YceI